MRISDWSSDVCSSDLYLVKAKQLKRIAILSDHSSYATGLATSTEKAIKDEGGNIVAKDFINAGTQDYTAVLTKLKSKNPDALYFSGYYSDGGLIRAQRSEEHTSELQSLMRTSYAAFCLTKHKAHPPPRYHVDLCIQRHINT